MFNNDFCYLCLRLLNDKSEFMSFLTDFFKKDANNVKLIIPEDDLVIASSTLNGLPSVIVLNTALRKFKHKNIFGWTCSLWMEFKELADNEMPTSDESQLVIEYLEGISKQIIGDPVHPNALFLARETTNGHCRMIWQLYDPKPVDSLLKSIIEEKSYPREFEYKIEYDTKWKGVSWFLKIK